MATKSNGQQRKRSKKSQGSKTSKKESLDPRALPLQNITLRPMPPDHPLAEGYVVGGSVTLPPEERPKPTLYYTTAPHNGGVVFARAADAARADRLRGALSSCTTWSALRRALPAEDFSEIDELVGGAPKRGRFDASSIPGYDEGDFPEWLQPEMDTLIDGDLLARYGRRTSTFVDGSYWHIPREKLDELCAELRERGYALERRDDLYFY